MIRRRVSMRGTLVVGLACLAIAAAAPAAAQTAVGVTNAVQGFSANRNQPIKINADSLEIRDKEKKATFIGRVHLVQGDTTLRCKTLVVYYDQETGPADVKRGDALERAPQQIRRLEAKGGVTVTQKDQTASGDSGVFDMRANTVTLIGNVVMTQGKNVVRGDRVTVDLTTGVSRVEAGKSGDGRVQGLFLPDSANQKSDPSSGKPAPKSVPPAPLRLN